MYTDCDAEMRWCYGLNRNAVSILFTPLSLSLSLYSDEFICNDLIILLIEFLNAVISDMSEAVFQSLDCSRGRGRGLGKTVLWTV